MGDLKSALEPDALGRPSIADSMRQQIERELSTLPPNARGALIVIADETGARAHLAGNLSGGWKVAAGAGFRWNEKKPSGFVAVQRVW